TPGCGRVGYDLLSGPGGVSGSGTGGRGGSSVGGMGGTNAGGRGGSSNAGTGGSGNAGAGGSSAGGTGGLAGAPCTPATYGGHAYALCDGPLPWTSAGNDCTVKGMRLARIDDVAENTWLQATAFANAPDVS